MKYAIKLKEGKIESYQILSESYIGKFKKDESNPLNKGYILVDSLGGHETYPQPIPKTEKEKILEILELTNDQLEKIKKL